MAVFTVPIFSGLLSGVCLCVKNSATRPLRARFVPALFAPNLENALEMRWRIRWYAYGRYREFLNLPQSRRELPNQTHAVLEEGGEGGELAQ